MIKAIEVNDEEIMIMAEDGPWSISKQSYYEIKNGFADGFPVLQCVVHPNDVIGFLNEQNPKLFEVELEIEKNKLRRKMANQAVDVAKLALPFVMIIIGAVIAYKMLGDGGAATTAIEAAGSIAPPISIT